MSRIQEDESIKLILNLDSLIRVFFDLCSRLVDTTDSEDFPQGPNTFQVGKLGPPEFSFPALLEAEESKYKSFGVWCVA